MKNNSNNKYEIKDNNLVGEFNGKKISGKIIENTNNGYLIENIKNKEYVFVKTEDENIMNVFNLGFSKYPFIKYYNSDGIEEIELYNEEKHKEHFIEKNNYEIVNIKIYNDKLIFLYNYKKELKLKIYDLLNNIIFDELNITKQYNMNYYSGIEKEGNYVILNLSSEDKDSSLVYNLLTKEIIKIDSHFTYIIFKNNIIYYTNSNLYVNKENIFNLKDYVFYGLKIKNGECLAYIKNKKNEVLVYSIIIGEHPELKFVGIEEDNLKLNELLNIYKKKKN